MDGVVQREADGRPATEEACFRLLDVILVAAVAGGVFLLAYFALWLWLAPSMRAAGGAIPTAGLLALLLLEPVAIFAGIYFPLVLWRGFTWADLGVRPVARRWIGIAVGGAILSLGFAGVVTPLLDRFYPEPMIDKYVAALAPHGVTWTWAITLVATIGVLVPLAEELLFRGVLYRWLRQRWGVPLSAVASAAVFALAHGSPRLALQIFFAGLVLAWLFERTRSILASAVAHAAINSASLVVILAYAGPGRAI